MRRVVVTGMGIISPIGNSLDEVTESLRLAKPGIVFAEDYAELGFRSQVKGDPRLDPFEVLDRRVTRFMGKGAAWNYLAMQQAIADAGLEESDISNPHDGHRHGVRRRLHPYHRGSSRRHPLVPPKPNEFDST